jgi:hypothetical protein
MEKAFYTREGDTRQRFFGYMIIGVRADTITPPNPALFFQPHDC